MSEKYDKNGYNSSDFKRNSNQEPNAENLGDQDGENNPVNEKAGEYMRELLSEKIKLNNGKFPLSTKLLDQEVVRVQANGRVPQNDSKYVDVYRDKAVKVTVKVLVPVKDHPKFNFVGKLLGPKGNTMKQLQEETMCKMAVLGRGSVRDRQKEEELRNSLDPKYAHLLDELHVEISALAPPAEAHARIAYALAEVKKYLIPDTNDFIRQNQMRDMTERDVGPGIGPGPGPGPGRRALLEGPEVRPKNVMYSACTVTKRSFSYRDPILNNQSEVPGGRPLLQNRGAPGKTKVLSILDRARTAMETSYPYEDPYAVPEQQVRGVPRGVPPPDDFYYERGQDRFYEEPYYKEEREYKPARDVGSRRAPRYPRAAPYARPPKSSGSKKISERDKKS
ncbi:PREDICTED: KH domain-containing, RNA-binding, signal transduction-associated protein 2-like isoform X1 [Papilio xuthus]|uniref:KH domain-containing, RNA-binding, signal transduction-associated protein 2-like isoform X1 n=2 Tax=Papilio xuthus TaxID=66420 RepID=A0AAJ7ELQ9_PAPXU|nr:PREDICTED: KH domain-containing, RNA-binding, signal transduction-associated protein 2-like isoform X1 [Papilio xuthus]